MKMKSMLMSSPMAALLACTVTAAEPQAGRKGLLKDLPSPEGPHIAKIKAMDDNTWLELGQPSPDPKWGEGLGRAWSSKMPYAPDLRGAFLCGEGRHGGTATRNGKRHYNDDLFFYDINAHRWICLHPGQELGKYHAKFNEDGLEVDKDDHPLPIAWMVHAYGGVTYDPDRREFLTCHNPAGGGYWRKSMPERLAFFEKHGESQYLPANRMKISLSPWIYRVDAGHWDRKKTESGPRSGHGHGRQLIYLPWLKETFYLSGDHWRSYDPRLNTWKTHESTGPVPPRASDAASCVDSKRKRIYMAMGSYGMSSRARKTEVTGIDNRVWAYDVEKKLWIDLQAKGKLPPRPRGVDGVNVSTMHYNSVCDKVLYFAFGKDLNDSLETRGVYAYAADKNEWELASGMKTEGNRKHHGFYDPKLNVHFMFTASDSGGGGKMYVYRYKRAKQK